MIHRWWSPGVGLLLLAMLLVAIGGLTYHLVRLPAVVVVILADGGFVALMAGLVALAIGVGRWLNLRGGQS